MNEHLRSIVESIEAIAKQRDDARAEAERLHAALVSDGEAMANLCGLLELTDAVASREEGQQMVHAAVEKLKAERDALREAARGLLDALREAARGRLADLDRPIGSMPWACRECDRVSTCRANGVCYCDEHSYEGAKDATYAAPLRALRALLEGKP